MPAQSGVGLRKLNPTYGSLARMGICANAAMPVVLALGAAFFFALGIQFTRKGLRHIDSRTGTLVSIGTATLLYWAVSPWLLERHYLCAVVHAASGYCPVSRTGNHRPRGARCVAGRTRSRAGQHGPLIVGARCQVRILAHDASLALEPSD